MQFWQNVKSRARRRYITWRTGASPEQQEWEAWYESMVNYRARDITDMFRNFRHVLQVDPDRFFDHSDPFSWVPCAEASVYFWPKRPLGENAVWRFERVSRDPWDHRWHLDEIGGQDRVFVATNNDDDAVMISLRFS